MTQEKIKTIDPTEDVYTAMNDICLIAGKVRSLGTLLMSLEESPNYIEPQDISGVGDILREIADQLKVNYKLLDNAWIKLPKTNT